MEHQQKASTIILQLLQGAVRAGCSLQRMSLGAEGKDGQCPYQQGTEYHGMLNRGRLISSSRQGQPRVQIIRQAQGRARVNESVQVVISKVHSQPQAQLQGS